MKRLELAHAETAVALRFDSHDEATEWAQYLRPRGEIVSVAAEYLFVLATGLKARELIDDTARALGYTVVGVSEGQP